MQASSPAAAGAQPATPFGMSRSRIGYAFLGVLLAHAALIALFVTADRAPALRPVRSTAIVAQLLSPQADATHVAVQSAPQAPAERVHTELDRQPPHTPSRVPPAHAPAHTPAAATARAPIAAAARAMSPAPAATPAAAQRSEPGEPVTRAPSAAAQSATPSASAPPVAAPAARETLAVAAPKHVEHADCRIVKPTYPELSKRRDETGTVTVRFIIGATGAIETVAVVKSSGFVRLDDAAVEALRASTCQPYLENGSPIRVSYMQAFTFGLDDD